MKKNALITRICDTRCKDVHFFGRVFCSTVLVISDSSSDNFPTFNRHAVLKFLVEYPDVWVASLLNKVRTDSLKKTEGKQLYLQVWKKVLNGRQTKQSNYCN